MTKEEAMALAKDSIGQDYVYDLNLEEFIEVLYKHGFEIVDRYVANERYFHYINW